MGATNFSLCSPRTPSALPYVFRGRLLRRRGTRRCAHARGTLLAYPALCLRGIGARGPLVGKVYRNAHLDDLPPTHKTARTALQRHMRGNQPNAQPALRTAHKHDQLRSDEGIDRSQFHRPARTSDACMPTSRDQPVSRQRVTDRLSCLYPDRCTRNSLVVKLESHP